MVMPGVPLINGGGVVVGMAYKRSNVREFIADDSIYPGDLLTLASVQVSNEDGTQYRVRRPRLREEVFGQALSYAHPRDRVEVAVHANDPAPSSGSPEYPANIPGIITTTSEHTGPVIEVPAGHELWVGNPPEDATMVHLPWSWGCDEKPQKPKRRRKRKARAKKVAPVPFVEPPGTRRFSF